MCDNRQGLTLFHRVSVSVSVRVHVLCVHASLPLWVSVSVCVYHLLVCRFSLSGRTLPRDFPHVPPQAVEMKRRTGRTTPPPRPLPPTLSTQVSDRPGVCTESDVLRRHQIRAHVCVFLLQGPKLYKEPSAKSNKHIIQNALAHCCLAGRVNEGQKNKILDVCSAFSLLPRSLHF